MMYVRGSDGKTDAESYVKHPVRVRILRYLGGTSGQTEYARRKRASHFESHSVRPTTEEVFRHGGNQLDD